MPYITEEQKAKYDEIERRRKETYKKINERNKRYITRVSVAIPNPVYADFKRICDETGSTQNGMLVSLVKDFIRDYDKA